MKQIKKIFLFIKKYWFIVLTIGGVITLLILKLSSNGSTKDEIQKKVDTIKKDNDKTIKQVDKEIEEIDKEIEEVKKNRQEIIKNKKERDEKANKYFKKGDL